MSTQQNKDATKLITVAAILSYPWLSEPQPPMAGSSNPKLMYSAVLVFDPATMAKYPQFGTSLDPLYNAAKTALLAKFGDKLPALQRNPNFKPGIRGDIEGKGYPEGSVFVNARNERRPGLVYLYPDPSDGKPAVVADADVEDVFYPGAIVRASIRAFGFDTAGNKGAAFALNNIQLLDGTAPRLDSRKAAKDDFTADASAAPAPLDDLGV